MVSWDLPWPEIESVSPALAGRFFTTDPPGKPPNCGIFFKIWDYQTILPASWETYCMQVKKQWLEPDMEQQAGLKLEKEYVKAIYYHPAYLTYMYNTSHEMLGWMKHKLESRLLGEISTTSNMQMIYFNLGSKWRGTKEVIDEGERGEWKIWLKTQHSKN